MSRPDAYTNLCANEEVMRHTGASGPVGADAAWRQMALFLGDRPAQQSD